MIELIIWWAVMPLGIVLLLLLAFVALVVFATMRTVVDLGYDWGDEHDA